MVLCHRGALEIREDQGVVVPCLGAVIIASNCHPTSAAQLQQNHSKEPLLSCFLFCLAFQSTPLPPACSLTGFRQNSLNLLQSNTSTLIMNSSFLQTHGEAFQIKVTGRGKQGLLDCFEIVSATMTSYRCYIQVASLTSNSTSLEVYLWVP